MGNEGLWSAGLEGTVERLNAMFLQKGGEADFDVTQTGLTFFETATGKVKRSNGATWDVMVEVDPAAASAGLRTLGTGASQASAGDHTHTPTMVQEVETEDAPGAQSIVIGTQDSNLLSTPITMTTRAITIANPYRTIVIVGTAEAYKVSGGGPVVYKVDLKLNGISKISQNMTLSNGDRDSVVLIYTEEGAAEQAHTVILELSADTDGHAVNWFAALAAIEVKVS